MISYPDHLALPAVTAHTLPVHQHTQPTLLHSSCLLSTDHPFKTSTGVDVSAPLSLLTGQDSKGDSTAQLLMLEGILTCTSNRAAADGFDKYQLIWLRLLQKRDTLEFTQPTGKRVFPDIPQESQ